MIFFKCIIRINSFKSNKAYFLKPNLQKISYQSILPAVYQRTSIRQPLLTGLLWHCVQICSRTDIGRRWNAFFWVHCWRFPINDLDYFTFCWWLYQDRSWLFIFFVLLNSHNWSLPPFVLLWFSLHFTHVNWCISQRWGILWSIMGHIAELAMAEVLSSVMVIIFSELADIYHLIHWYVVGLHHWLISLLWNTFITTQDSHCLHVHGTHSP